ncbi:MAG: putative response regulator receiver protein, partial [Phycisphaerales bacterium]|nr:putative response regulator receiver protein [Phycisphaerales bacterium]
DTRERGVDVIDTLQAAQAAGKPYNVLITDSALRDMDGATLVDRLHADKGLQLPVLMLTANHQPVSGADRLKQNGVRGFVSKPVRQSQLFDSVMTALAHGAPVNKARPIIDHVAYSLMGLRVLLVEDNEVNQMVAGDLLRHAGCEVEIAGNGAEAIDRLKQNADFDVILMDCQMPIMDGFEAATHLREMKRQGLVGEWVPVIALTANAINGDREKCLAAGMDDYVSKPIDAVALVETIGRHAKPRPFERPAPAVAPQAASMPPVVAAPVVPVPVVADAEIAAMPVDVPQLVRRCTGRADFAMRVLEKFMEQLDTRVAEVSTTALAGQAEACRKAAHQLKGSAATVAAVGLAKSAAAIEAAATQGTLENVLSDVDSLRLMAEECIKDLPRIRGLLVKAAA